MRVGTLNHPDIAHIYAIEEVDGDLLIVMEYIEGRELRELIVEPPEALSLRGVLDYAKSRMACRPPMKRKSPTAILNLPIL